MTRSERQPLHLRDQRGFTLVELLVGLAAGMVVAIGLFTILDVTLKQTTRTFSRIDATQRARVALASIGTEMRSACLENRIVPIRYLNSTRTSVSFWSQYGKAASPLPVLHTVAYDSTAKTLVDTTYPLASNSGNEPTNWVPDTANPSRTNTLLTNVDPSPGVPMFQYFTSSSTGQIDATPSGTSALLSNTAEKVTEVRMTMVVRPAGGANEDSNVAANTVTNTVLLRLTPLPNPGGTNNTDFDPCS